MKFLFNHLKLVTLKSYISPKTLIHRRDRRQRLRKLFTTNSVDMVFREPTASIN